MPDGPPLQAEPLEIPAYLETLRRGTTGYRVRPDLDEASAAWLFDLLARKVRFGRLRRELLRRDGNAVGRCVWYEKPGATGQVVQVGAAPDSVGAVFAWLAHEARAAGMTALAAG